MQSHCMTTWMIMLMIIGFTSSDLSKDTDECQAQLVGVATCLPYVGGTTKEPTLDCCNGLKQVLGKSRKCICILVKDIDDPNLGLKINATLALRLPPLCNTAFNVSECLDLLHLAPNSPDAQVFQQYINGTKRSAPVPNAKGNGANSPSPAPNKKATNDGCKTKMSLGVKMVVGVVFWHLTSIPGV